MTTPDPTDKLAADQFQPAHRDGYGDHLATALDRAARGYALSTSEAQALAREVARLRGCMEAVRLRDSLRSIARIYENGSDTMLSRSTQAYDMRCTARRALSEDAHA